MINFHHIDCMEFMAKVPDKFYRLAIVDPPYGIGKDGQIKTTGGHGGRKAHAQKGWDKTRPSENYFSELFRITQNQIIWGANYYPEYLKGTMGWIFWDKGQDINQSDGEIAFTSFESALRRIKMNRVELLKQGTIHPTEKPIKLYRWLLQNYAKPGDNIIDTHGGSMSIAIACDMEGFDLDICEIDREYFDAGVKRFNEYKRQLTLDFNVNNFANSKLDKVKKVS
jgi:site-specific DNA-methyltransferase (adenine-specific)